MLHFDKLSLLAFLLVFPTAICSFEITKVGLWDRFETTITPSKNYPSPYETPLRVTYTRPDGDTIEFIGFYDGDQTWKIRFMPDQLGEWSYRATFYKSKEITKGKFECVPSEIPGMLSVDETNPMWFGFKGGNHVLIRSFHVGDRFFAENWPDAKRTEFLDWLVEQDYNMLSIASHYLNRDTEGRGKGWDTPALWPLDAAEYRKMEAILDELAKRQIMVYPFAGFFGKNSDFPTDSIEQEQYIRYMLARIGPYWNLLFNVAGPEPNLKKANFLTIEKVTSLGKLIKSLDIFNHPISVHNRTGDDPYKNSSWTDYGILQGPKTKSRKKLSEGLLANHHPKKPLYAQETLWPGNKYHPDYSEEDIRKNAFVIHMSATALNYADMDGNSSSGFSGSLDLSKRHQSWHDIIKKVWDFFESIPYYTMKPHQDLVDNGFCLANPGKTYLVYLESGGTVNVQIEEGQYEVVWINAQNTFDQRKAGMTQNGKNLQSPKEGDDWLVFLQHEKLSKAEKPKRTYSTFSINETNSGTLLNDHPFLVTGLRVSNALISDEKTQELIDNMDIFALYGVNTFSVFFQGSRFGDIKGYNKDGTLNPIYAKRMARIIEEADARGMVILVGCLYYGNSKGKWEDWKQDDANRAIANTVRWLKENNYRNVLIDVNNEQMADFDDSELIAAGEAVDSEYVIGTSGKITPENADLSMHHGNPNIPGKYYIQTEGTGVNYWGDYSKKEGLYNYINIGIYPSWMKMQMKEYTKRFLENGQGFIFASTWLQCPPPSGPNHTPGGMGTQNNPGILWWLEHVHSLVGAYEFTRVE